MPYINTIGEGLLYDNTMLETLFSETDLNDDQLRRKFCFNLMRQFKLMNLNEGLTGAQALWLHHRARAWEITYDGVPMSVDLVNMAYSGDCETTYLALSYGTADSMSEAHHSWSQARIDFLKLEIAKYLGWI